MESKHGMGLFISRLGFGILFLFTGIGKLINPAGIIGMVQGIGFPAPGFFGWLVLLSEIIFGLAVLLGYKVKWTVIPLAVILTVAAFFVYLPASDPMHLVNFFIHIALVGSLIAIGVDGPGMYSIEKKKSM